MTLIRTTLFALAINSLCCGAFAGDRMLRPDPSVLPAPADAASIQTALDKELAGKFGAITRHSNRLLTREAAVNAGWGFVSDHFGDIDRDNDGFATLAEVQDFLDTRSPIAKTRNRPVQKVE